MTYFTYFHDTDTIIYDVEDPIGTDPYAPRLRMRALQLLAARWARVGAQCFDRFEDPRYDRRMQAENIALASRAMRT